MAEISRGLRYELHALRNEVTARRATIAAQNDRILALEKLIVTIATGRGLEPLICAVPTMPLLKTRKKGKRRG